MSAVASVNTPGVLPTQMPRSVHAGTSMLLKPTAKLLATLRRGAWSSKLPSILSVRSDAKPSQVVTLCRNTFAGGGNCLGQTSRSHAALMSLRPASGMMRVTKTLGLEGMRSFLARATRGELTAQHAAHDVGSLGDLSRRHIEMSAGPHRVRRGGVHEQTVRLESRGHFARCAQLRVELEPDQVGFDFGRSELHAGDIGQRLGQYFRVGVIFGEALDVVVQGVKARGRQHADLAHAAAEEFANAPALGDESLGTGQR